MTATPLLCHARDLQLPGPAAPLSFSLHAGLTLVCGGEGRGKSSLLRILAGQQAASGGTLERAGTVFLVDMRDEALDQQIVRAWLRHQQQHHPDWQNDTAAALIEAWDLGEHLDKPLYMLSAGSRRKVGLVAAAASNATLTLLDQPWSALDARSGRILAELLGDAAESSQRAWVVADYECPAALDGLPLANRIDLGD